ncbi:MAG: ATP-binding cassette domain-containing protein [Bacteroidetes bacterium]|nr:ATP-binding cassette domain-containing protein [Bacteroidota bacterium]
MQDDLIKNLCVSNKRAVARSISIVESNNNESAVLLKKIFPKIGNAHRIGITGPPGAGKSTITNHLTKYYRKQNKKVGIIAVDPTSPFTGGALLGDRVRMSEIGQDEGVFIRSMATRGSLGGLSNRTVDAADVLDAAGREIIDDVDFVAQLEIRLGQGAAYETGATGDEMSHKSPFSGGLPMRPTKSEKKLLLFPFSARSGPSVRARARDPYLGPVLGGAAPVPPTMPAHSYRPSMWHF